MKMIDALYPLAIPAGTTCDIIAAYIDHPANPQSYQQAVTRFPDAVHVKICIHPSTIGALVIDCESGTHTTPAETVDWVLASRAAGIDPAVYGNEHLPWGWSGVRAAFKARGVPEPHYWVADYSDGGAVPAGAVAIQYTDLDQNGHNTYDTSNTVPGWPTGDSPLGTGTQLGTSGDWMSEPLSAANASAINGIVINVVRSQEFANIIAQLVANVVNPQLATVMTGVNNSTTTAANVLTAVRAIPSSGGAVNVQPIVDAIGQLPAAVVAEIASKLGAPTS